MSSLKLPCALPLDIAPEHALEYEQIAYAIRDQTIEVYEACLAGQPIADPSQWKRVKQREGIDIYGLRDRNPMSPYHKPLDPTIGSPETREHAWWAPQIKLRLMGQALGSIDDIMFSSIAPTELSMLKRSASNKDEFVDHRNLLEIRLPTVDEPFTYSGLKWSVRSTYLGSLIKARDMTHIEASGYAQIYHNGRYERVGFLVYHSLTLPQLPPLSSQGIIRSRFSVCSIVRQATPTVVQIFATTSLFPGGELPHKVTSLQAADALFAVCKMPETTMKKKLVWMQHARAYGRPNATSVYLTEQGRNENFQRTICEQCGRKRSALKSVGSCGICLTEVCSRCLTSLKLVYGDQREEIREQSVTVCKRCIATAKRMDNAAALAVYEFVDPFDSLRPPSQRLSRTASTASATSIELYVDNEQSPMKEPTYSSIRPTSRPHRPMKTTGVKHQERLWQQINELCLQAERTYRQTQQQAFLAQQALERRE